MAALAVEEGERKEGGGGEERRAKGWGSDSEGYETERDVKGESGGGGGRGRSLLRQRVIKCPRANGNGHHLNLWAAVSRGCVRH